MQPSSVDGENPKLPRVSTCTLRPTDQPMLRSAKVCIKTKASTRLNSAPILLDDPTQELLPLNFPQAEGPSLLILV